MENPQEHKIVQAFATWNNGTYTIFTEPPCSLWDVEESASSELIALYHEVTDDQQKRRTGRIAGVEIIGLLEIENWDIAPTLPILWRLYEWEPMPLAALLERVRGSISEAIQNGSRKAVLELVHRQER